MAFEQPTHHVYSGCIERSERLIQNPERPRSTQLEASEGQAAFLALGKDFARDALLRRDPKSRECFLNRRRLRIQSHDPRGISEILECVEFVLNCVQVAD